MDDVRHVVVKVTDTQVWTVSGGFSVCPLSVSDIFCIHHQCLCMSEPNLHFDFNGTLDPVRFTVLLFIVLTQANFDVFL